MHEFRLDDTSAALVSASPNKEKHGDEWIDRIDMRLSKQGNKELLGMLIDSPTKLMAVLWEKNGDRVRGLKRLVFDAEVTGHRVTVTDDAGREIVLTDAKINSFAAELDDMSICDLSFRVQAHPGEAEDMGWLCHMQREVVRVTITPGDELDTGEDDGQADVDDSRDDAA